VSTPVNQVKEEVKEKRKNKSADQQGWVTRGPSAISFDPE
jgi:hypothetical protein